MSWLSSFWDHNRNFLGNALKNISPAAFLIPGVGPLAAAGLGGLGSAIGAGIQKGANFGSIAKQGLTGAGESYLGSELTGGQGDSLSRLKNLFHGGSPASQAVRAAAQPGPAVPTAFSPSSSLALPATGGVSGAAGAGGVPGIQLAGSASALPVSAATAALPTSLRAAAPGIGSVLKGIGGFAKDNAMATALGLQGASQLAALPAENRLKRSQQDAIDLANKREKEQQAWDEEQARQLEPLRQLFMASLQNQYANRKNYGPVPY